MQTRNLLAKDAHPWEAHILGSQFFKLRLEEAARLMPLDKSLYTYLSKQDFWQNAVKRHFILDFHQLKSQPNINWLSTFGMLRRKHYAKLRTRTKQLFSLTKEGDVEQLKKLAFALDDLFLEDAHNKWPLHSYLSASNSQALLDHCYKNLLLPFDNDLLLENIHDRFLLSFYISTTNQQSLLDPWYQMLLLFSYLDRHTIIKEKMAASGRTPLHWAVAFNQITAVDLLISKGADFNTAAKDGTTPLFIAAEFGRLAIVEALIAKKATINAAPLCVATQNGHLAVVQALIAGGANINAALNTGATPLYIAAQYGYLAIFEALIAKGANIHTARNDGETPLYITAQNGHLATLEALIAKGANIHTARNDGATPLFVAAQNGHLTTVQTLIAKGANVNAARNDGETPLSIATSAAHHAIAKILSKIKLNEFIAQTMARTSSYKTSLTLFGRTFNFGYSAEAELFAALALNALSEGADESLEEHIGVLSQGELEPLYYNLMRK